jgi:hypothetical protein
VGRRRTPGGLTADTVRSDEWESLGEEEWQGGGLYFRHGAEELLVMQDGKA